MAADQATGPRRAYRSPRREQQAAETRAMVASAAARLFGERGWAATGMREVARAAGVSVETVYASFRSKGDLLLAAIDVAVVGDAAPVPLDQRPEFAALGSGTRRQRARATASLVAGINQRTAGVVLALREAGASDADRLSGGASVSSGGGSTSSRARRWWPAAPSRPRRSTGCGRWSPSRSTRCSPSCAAGLRSNTKTGWPTSLNGCCPARTSVTYVRTG